MRTFSVLALPIWALLGTAGAQTKVSELRDEPALAFADDIVPDPFRKGCGEAWRTWPTVQQRAVESGTVMVFDLVSRVGNAFLDLRNVIEVSE